VIEALRLHALIGAVALQQWQSKVRPACRRGRRPSAYGLDRVARRTRARSPWALKTRAAFEILLGADFEAKMLRGRYLAVAQHQRVMLLLLDAAQIEGLPVGVLDDEAEGFGIEGSATTKVGDTQADGAGGSKMWFGMGIWRLKRRRSHWISRIPA
jgi:hypothetical protein